MNRLILLLTFVVAFTACANNKTNISTHRKIAELQNELSDVKVEFQVIFEQNQEYKCMIDEYALNNKELGQMLKDCEKSCQKIIRVENNENVLFIYFSNGEIMNVPLAHSSSPIPLILYERKLK